MMSIVKLPENALESLIVQCQNNSNIINYKEILQRENVRVNLVSRETFPDGFFRLAAESLLPFQQISKTVFQNHLDIGSGGGFPSIPVILSGHSENSTLVERTGKKASALKRMLDELHPDYKIEILNKNFDEIKFNRKFDLITIRLVKLDSSLYKKLDELLKSDGMLVYYSTTEFKTSKTASVVTYSYSIKSKSIDKSFTIITKK